MNQDLQYIDSWSLKLDFVILLNTLRVVLSGVGEVKTEIGDQKSAVGKQ